MPQPFPKWTNWIRPGLAAGSLIVPVYLGVIITYGFSPMATDVGYQPTQPVPYSHALHAGDLGMDCRYCHVTVEKSHNAAVPPTQTCMGCHYTIFADSDALKPVRDSFASGKPVEWVRVHDLSDFVYFNHSAHVDRGVGCVECHGRIDRMDKVFQAKPLSMNWCLECHRNPQPRVRPLSEITNMSWVADANWIAEGAAQFIRDHKINPPTDCSTCHR